MCFDLTILLRLIIHIGFQNVINHISSRCYLLRSKRSWKDSNWEVNIILPKPIGLTPQLKVHKVLSLYQVVLELMVWGQVFVNRFHSLAAPHASQGGHRTTLTCKNVYIHLPKKKIHAKLPTVTTPNKNVRNPDLKITKIWIQQK